MSHLQPIPSGQSALVCVDLDNLKVSLGNGFDRINISAFCQRAYREMGSDDCSIIVFANGMSAGEEAVWNRFGAVVVRTRVNADPIIEECLLAARKCARVLIASGDHIFAKAARWHAELGHRTVVWARKAKASYELVFSADQVNFIDDLILAGPANSNQRWRAVA